MGATPTVERPRTVNGEDLNDVITVRCSAGRTVQLSNACLPAPGAILSQPAFAAVCRGARILGPVLRWHPHQAQPFLDLHIPNGRYAGGETQESIARKLTSLDLGKYASPLDVYLDPKLTPFEYSTEAHCLKDLVAGAIHCSAKMNFALSISTKHGFSPLADASPFNDLLSTKYRRALRAVSDKTTVAVPATDLSLAILDELVPSESLFNLKLGDVIKYRRDSERAREAFLEHLAALQHKLSAVPVDGDYGQAIKELIDTDIRPAATTFRNRITTVHEKLFGSIAKGVITGAPVAAAHFMGDLSWPLLLGMAGTAGFIRRTKLSMLGSGKCLLKRADSSSLLPDMY